MNEVFGQKMSYRSAFTVTNIVFLIGGVYFALVAVLNEATVYTAFLSVLCFVSFIVSLREGLYFAGPWRVASATAVLVLLAGQEVVSFGAASTADFFTAATIVLNGVLFVVFFGVLLSCAREVTKQKTSEEAEEEGKEAEASAS